jgi:hypothetical protein
VRRRRTVPAPLLAFSVFATLIALTGAQSTGATAGPRLLGRLAAALFELDRWVPAHAEDIAAAARDRTRGLVGVDGLPVRVLVTQAAASADGEELGAAIADAAGQRLYSEGRVAFVDGEGANGDISLTQPTRWAIALLEQEEHSKWQFLLYSSALSTLALFGLVSVTSLGGVGMALRTVAIASGIATVLAIGAWLLCEAVARITASPPNAETARLLASCLRLGLQDAVVVGLGAGIINFALRSLTPQPRPLRQWPAVDEPA